MSKPFQRNGPAPRRPGEEDDFCPVCKSSRYLNPDLRFLVNPECYHKMCTSCVDRIFSSGPAPCPVAGCARTLRKQRFRQQTFGDINVEREVDIRRRVAQVFNRREAEFATLLDYNNYLEKVEDLTFNLMNNVDVATTEATLASHAAQNASSISRNAAIIGRESASVEAQLTAQKEALRQRRVMAKEEEEQEKAEREEGQKEILDKLASSSGNADQIMREGQKVVLKKSTARRTAAEKARQAQSDSTAARTGASAAAAESSFQILGLKPIVETEREKPYDPFGGLSMQREYYQPQEHIDHPWMDKARTDPVITAGGYDLKEYYARTLLEAFAGLGCFIAEEMAATDRMGAGAGAGKEKGKGTGDLVGGGKVGVRGGG